MDVHGWVPIEVVCGFKRVRQLSVNEEAVIQVITMIRYDMILLSMTWNILCLNYVVCRYFCRDSFRKCHI